MQRLDPTDLPKNIVVPPVHIEAFIADKIGYSVQAVPRLPALTRDLQIDYTALSFPIPQRVRFRYRLDGIDTEWQDVSNRRQAFYTSLKPGTYTFHVIACNNDGVWNETGAAIKFSVAPTYYQAMWFQLLCAGAIAGLLWIAYLARLRYVTDQIQRSLGTRMEERERIARELHDTLLQGVQGLMLRFQSLMRRLSEQEPVRQMMGQVLDRADEVLLEGRQRVRDLRAEGITANGLGVNVRRCGEELAQDYPVAFYLTITGAPQVLDPTVSNEVYQIAREALTNAFQHSKGSRVEARIIYHQASLRVVVIDDGRGIEEGILDRGRAGHWGVAGMRERAQKIGAKLDFRSHADRGTEIDLAVPAWLAYYQNGTISVRRRVGRALAKLGRRSSP